MATPLTDTDLETINANLVQIKAAKEQIKLARQAGLNVDALQETATQHEAQLLKLKSTYFPNA